MPAATAHRSGFALADSANRSWWSHGKTDTRAEDGGTRPLLDDLPYFRRQLGKVLDRTSRQASKLVVQRNHDLKKLQDGAKALLGVQVRRRGCFDFFKARAQRRHRGVDLAALALIENHAEHLPGVLDRLVVLLAVPAEMNGIDQSPVLQFAQACTHIGAGKGQRRGDVFRVQWLAGQVKERMDLCHRPVHSPPRAHFSPQSHKLLGRLRQLHSERFESSEYFVLTVIPVRPNLNGYFPSIVRSAQ